MWNMDVVKLAMAAKMLHASADRIEELEADKKTLEVRAAELQREIAAWSNENAALRKSCIRYRTALSAFHKGEAVPGSVANPLHYTESAPTYNQLVCLHAQQRHTITLLLTKGTQPAKYSNIQWMEAEPK